MKSYFKPHELACRCGCGTVFVSARALKKLNIFREILGVPFSPNSAARCPTHNARVGGKPLSQHRSTEARPSTAFDIPIKPGMSKQEIIHAAEKAGFGGIGVNYRTFVHIDDRGRRARW